MDYTGRSQYHLDDPYYSCRTTSYFCLYGEGLVFDLAMFLKKGQHNSSPKFAHRPAFVIVCCCFSISTGRPKNVNLSEADGQTQQNFHPTNSANPKKRLRLSCGEKQTGNTHQQQQRSYRYCTQRFGEGRKEVWLLELNYYTPTYQGRLINNEEESLQLQHPPKKAKDYKRCPVAVEEDGSEVVDHRVEDLLVGVVDLDGTLFYSVS
mmetsp:Transcript_11259/g.26731  ORF Transcript_11259/g.26731 Transcript_11259/m.26731 type:complete len:207 (+) Transcript_11259:396-1016(+)